MTVVNWLATTRIPWAEVERFCYDGGLRRQHYAAAFSFVPGALPSANTRGRDAAVRLEAIRKTRRSRGGGRDH